MRFGYSHQHSRHVDVDMTAMIDVVFLLIVFFMSTAQFAKLTKAAVDLPLEQGEEERHAEDAGLVVNVTMAGAIIVDDREVSLSRLMVMVQTEIDRAGGDPAAVELWLRADKRAPAQSVNEIALALTELNVRSWRLATEQPMPGRSGRK